MQDELNRTPETGLTRKKVYDFFPVAIDSKKSINYLVNYLRDGNIFVRVVAGLLRTIGECYSLVQSLYFKDYGKMTSCSCIAEVAHIQLMLFHFPCRKTKINIHSSTNGEKFF